MSLVMLISGVCACIVTLYIWRRKRGIVYLGLTKGGPTSVHDNTSVLGSRIRVLEVAGTYQSATYLDERWADPVFPYHHLFDHAFDNWPIGKGPASAVILGGGGYTIPKHFVAHHPEVKHIDVVEISPTIQRIAQKYFFLDRLEQEFGAQKEGRLRLHTGDALTWLTESTRRYDLIVNDCFSGEHPEESLITSKAATVIHSHLTSQGRYLTNVVSALDGPDARMLYHTIQILSSSFAHVWVYPCSPNDPQLKDNNVVVASDVPCTFEGAWEWPTDTKHT